VLYSVICGACAGLLSALYELYSNDNFLTYSRKKIAFLCFLSVYAGGFVAFMTLNLLHKFIDLEGITQGVASLAGFGGIKTVRFLQRIFALKLESKINGGTK
jgi:hypothetical protein